MVDWRQPGKTILGVGEAMVEFAPVGDNLYRRGFAGDTLNTCWHLAQLLRGRAQVGYFTHVGPDAFSTEFLAFLKQSGIGTEAIVRDPERVMGLYVISLAGAERSFSYWRDVSAARRLADDGERLRRVVSEAGLIHVSGITLAIIGEGGRKNLVESLKTARSGGGVVAFDPNARPRLWRDANEMRRAFSEMFEVADVALPSFDDEAMLWGDRHPEATVERIKAFGVPEIVVKNGALDATLYADDTATAVPVPEVGAVCDTTGAGDAFNAGYLAARIAGASALSACAFAQAVAGEIISHFGALAPQGALDRFHAQISTGGRDGVEFQTG